MLNEYIRRAMHHAQYELMENGRCFATIPPCRGVWSDGTTIEETRTELQSVFEGWILLGRQLGHSIPIIDGVDLNPSEAVHAEADQAA